MPASRLAAALLLGVASLVCAACSERGPADPRPNVLLITVDTLRADRLGAHGFAPSPSPHIDALAEQGVVFERAIAAATSTAPSHASIMTSRYTRGHGIGYGNGDTHLGEEDVLAQHFAEAGYDTAAFVGNFVLRARAGLGRGFDVYDDELPHPERNREIVFERIAAETNERVLAWLATSGPGPFFLWVHYQDPHGPYDPPDSHVGRFRLPREEGEAPLEVAESTAGWNSIPAYQALPGLRYPSEYAGRYADEIFYADEAIGELLQAVDGHRSRRPAVVLFTSDHGESFGESERYFVHGFSTTPQLAHVPLILRAPGIPPGRRSEPASHVDAMPTLLELAGLEPPPEAHGIALGPYLRDGRPLPDRRVYCDIGTELAAYGEDDFVRVLGLGNAWKEDPIQEPAWLSFRWPTGGDWTLVETDPSVKPAIEAYYREALPMQWDREPQTREERELLEILGYAEPSSDFEPSFE